MSPMNSDYKTKVSNCNAISYRIKAGVDQMNMKFKSHKAVEISTANC
jgi:hypothetical protein